MEVTVLAPLHEDGVAYKVGDKFVTKPSRGWRLDELGLVKAPAPWEYKYEDEWAELRKFIGARPQGILAFPTRRSRLDRLRPGEKLLLIRKYGGLGDILIQSMIFPMLTDQYPDIRVEYAVPRQYHSLFEGTGVALRSYEEVFNGETTFHRGTVREELLSEFDLIEDLSIPCHVWENFFVAYGGIDQGSPLKWRNRLDMWARWFGLQVVNPRTCIRLRDQEIAEARTRFPKGGKVALVSPFAANQTKSYPWLRELWAALKHDGWTPVGLHSGDVPGIASLRSLTIRQMGAACAAADVVISVDTATFHWGGILGRPTVGVFNVNDGATYCRYYPTAVAVQTCDTPCINVRYGNRNGNGCPKHVNVPDHPGLGLALSKCYRRDSVDQIMEAVRGCQPVR